MNYLSTFTTEIFPTAAHVDTITSAIVIDLDRARIKMQIDFKISSIMKLSDFAT